MLISASENIRTMGPVFVFWWALTILCVLLRPQSYGNSILLLISLLVTVLFASGFFGENGPWFLLICFLLVMAALFLVPVLLIANGIQMIRKESAAPAHLLSLGLGIVVAVGEGAAVVYVLGLSGFLPAGSAGRGLLFLVFTVFYFCFLVLSFVLYSVFIQILPHRTQYDYIIIHGCGLADGERLTRLLSARVDKAVEVFHRCGDRPVIIPSGGQGEDEKLSEAQAMKHYLLMHGVPEEKILPEENSATTRENLLYSRQLIDARSGGKKTALVSSNYHIYRCLRLAREVGLKCTGIGAPVALYYWPSALIREFIAVFSARGFWIRALIGYVLYIGPFLYVLTR